MISVKEKSKIVWFEYKDDVCNKGIWLRAECECGKKYLFHTFCNREDCCICGKMYSFAHYRRYLRGLKYIQEIFDDIKVVGYLVITTIKENELNDKEKLDVFRRYVIRMLKRELGNDIKGVARWHFAGEKSRRWYPHLNILINRNFIKDGKLKRIKELIENKYNIRVVSYRYTRSFVKVLHWWRYISRPTFLLQNEIGYEVIKGLKNVCWFGKFEKKEKEYNKMLGIEFLYYSAELKKKGFLCDWDEFALFVMIHNRCFYCGKKLHFKLDDFYEKDVSNKVYLGCGYYVYR